MPSAFVQAATNGSGISTTGSPGSITPTSGNWLILLVGRRTTGALTVSDDQTGSTGWAQVATFNDGTRQVDIWAKQATNSNAHAITVSWTGSVVYGIGCFEATNADTTDASDGNSTASATTTYCAQAAGINVAAGAIVAAIAIRTAGSNTWTEGAGGYTRIGSGSTTFGIQYLATAGGLSGNRAEFTLGGAAATVGVVVALKAAPAGGSRSRTLTLLGC